MLLLRQELEALQVSETMLQNMPRKTISLRRRQPAECQHEPPYPGLHTVLFSIRDPDWTAHRKSKRCPQEGPHLIAKCGEFRSLPHR